MKKLKTLPPKSNGGSFAHHPAVQVDWDVYLDGLPWLATKGTDFHCTVRTFASRVYQAAKRKHKRVVVRIHDNTVAFQSQPSK